MKFSSEMEINLPIDKVVTLYYDKDSLSKWQDGFVSIEQISGNAGEKGAKSKILFKQGKHEMELIETILEVNSAYDTLKLYEHSHMVNTMHTIFSDLGNGKTKWFVDIEYTQFIGFMPKLMAFLFPGMFKKQGLKWFKQFKQLAESSNQ